MPFRSLVRFSVSERSLLRSPRHVYDQQYSENVILRNIIKLCILIYFIFCDDLP